MTAALILDIAIAALLVVTIAYAVTLNRRLAAMRKDREALENLAASFEKATGRAGDSIAKLKASTDDLQDSIRRAESVRDDLSFLLDRGGAAADRLETIVRAARKEAGMGPAAAKAAGEPDAEPTDDKDENADDPERALLRAIQTAR